MKISNDTLTILKNFASINKGILIKPGNKLVTRTDSLVAEAIIKEEFPLEVGIYDLTQFLNVINLFDSPEFEFGVESLRISEESGNAETLYAYAASGLVSAPHPKKKKELPSDIIEFTLTEEQWNKIQKATSILQREEVKISSDGKVVRMGTATVKGSSGNSFSTVLDADSHGLSCNMFYNKNHLPLLKGSYQGVVTSMYTMFKNTSGFDLTYYIGFEPTSSTFGSTNDDSSSEE